jgi:hypothetical protein
MSTEAKTTTESQHDAKLFVSLSLPLDLVQQVIRYCEDQQIYDKLSNYGDFYYKLKRITSVSGNAS